RLMAHEHEPAKVSRLDPPSDYWLRTKLVPQEPADEAQSQPPCAHRQPPHIRHEEIEAMQLAADMVRRFVYRDPAILLQCVEKKLEGGSIMVVIAPNGMRTCTSRQMLGEEPIDCRLANLLRHLAGACHPVRKVRDAAKVDMPRSRRVSAFFKEYLIPGR